MDFRNPMTAHSAVSPVLIAGIDEAGRGPLAGPVVAAAVILNHQRPIAGLADSKTLGPARRARLAQCIERQSLCWAVGVATVAEIDKINILQATLLAMERAIVGLALPPTRVLIDGNRLPDVLPCPGEAIVGGDRTVACIGAASIIAKTYRDRLMVELDALYPHHGFKNHKGYGTRRHLEALQRYGVTPVHRRSFAPVRRALRIDSQ